MSTPTVAYASHLVVRTSDIVNGAVTSPKIRDGAVKTPDLGLGSVTSAKVKNNSLTGADIKEGTLGPVPLALRAGNVLFAAVNSDGGLVKNQGATSSSRPATGNYLVGFNRDITNCVYIATPGDDVGFLSIPVVTYASRNGTNNVRVEFFRSSDNTAINRPFYLGVFC
ncbi:MAG: hypothetical protein GEV04_01280 [Actinophytocola sp.]|nr:hypothetical protein [Actinophytocola sp.]